MQLNDIRKVLSYNDVLLCPRYSGLDHISDADISYDYNHEHPGLGFVSPPIINAPMDKVCSPDIINLLHNEYDMPTTIHRWFDTPKEQINFYESCNLQDFNPHCFLAVGALAKWQHWIEALLEYRFKNMQKFGILIDMANGDTKACVETVKFIRGAAPIDCNIMAGNIATKSGFKRLQDAGANFIRCGIGGGSICSTRSSTSFGIPTLTTLLDCAKVKRDNVWLVADGGIEYSGDICKAMAAGADMVMVGKMLAATSLSNGEKIDIGDKKFVKYSGMASKEAIEKLKSKKSSISIEGVSGLIPYTGETREVIDNIIGNLQSAMAYYAGCKDWYEFKRNVKMVEISQQGWGESLTRVDI